jgi:hypothetical protein
MRILFLHGWQSIRGGVKLTYLKDHGHNVFNPAFDDDDFDAAAGRSHLCDSLALNNHRPGEGER